jgi:acyl-CoA reductase-like NAD-dependent aldehyde dehydrogenase
MRKYQMFIGGKWVDALSGQTFDDLDPYSGEVYAKVPKADVNDVDRVMAAAYEARKVWASTPPVERANLLYKAAQILDASQQEYLEVLTKEGGSTFGKAMFEITGTVELLKTAAADSKRIFGETYHTDPSKFSMTIRKPRGTIVTFSPWNFPLVLAMYKVAYGLATGNTIVLKPLAMPITPIISMEKLYMANLILPLPCSMKTTPLILHFSFTQPYCAPADGFPFGACINEFVKPA